MPLHAIDDADLSALNSFGLSARARRLASLEDVDDAPEAAALLSEAEHSLLLGAGSNVLFTSDFAGTIVKVATRGRAILPALAADRGSTEPQTIVEAAAGEPWHDFVLWTLGQGLYGLENLALIPGTVGAAPVQNIGAYGVEVRERIDSVEVISIDDGRRTRLHASECGFSYRNSIFRRRQAGSRWMIVSVRFALSRRPIPRLDYPDLKAEFADALSHPSPVQIAEAVCRIRRRKLPDPVQIGNAGSFFRNPVLSASAGRALAALHPGLPVYADPSSPDQVKIAAGWLIERCGWKGRRRGDAGVHRDHALVLVNHGSASGQAIGALARDIQSSVAERFGIQLEPEVVIV